MPTPDGQKLLPFYLVIDVSASMIGDKLVAANNIIPTIIDALAKDPILSDRVRFALIDFSQNAQVQLPLCDLLDPNIVIPGLATRTTTSYVAAFELLRREIPANVAQLKADGFVVHRPAVFFISDGAPDQEDWPLAFHQLTHYDHATGEGFPMYPNIVPCGVDGADPSVLKALIHPTTGSRAMKMYLMVGENPAVAITKIAEVLVASVIKSTSDPDHNGSVMKLPQDDDLPDGVSAYTAADDLV